MRPTLLAAAYDSSVDALLEPLSELAPGMPTRPTTASSAPRRRRGRQAAASGCSANDEAVEHVARGRRHARRLDARQRVVYEIRLIDVLLHPGLRLRDPGALRTDLAELCALARQLGLVDELSAALTLLARVYHWGWGDIPRAGALLQRSVDVISRAGHPMAEPLLQAARCLAYLEIDMPRTRDLFDGLARLGELAEASYQYHWGRGRATRKVAREEWLHPIGGSI